MDHLEQFLLNTFFSQMNGPTKSMFTDENGISGTGIRQISAEVWVVTLFAWQAIQNDAHFLKSQANPV